jgi:hypothetical protein
MLPFLKKAKEAGVSMPVEAIERKPDDEPSYDMLDAVCDDMMQAIEKKDKGLLKSALQSLCEHLQDMDQKQDENLKG